MRLYLGHMSALRAWRQVRQGRLPVPRRSACRSVVDPATSAVELAHCGLGPLADTTPPDEATCILRGCARDPSGGPQAPLEQLDVLVAKRSQRHRIKGVRHHLLTGEFPEGSFFLLANGVYLPSPELLLTLLSSNLSSWELIALAYELCGSYCLDPSLEAGFASHLEPLTSVDAIKRFLMEAKGLRGSARVGEVLHHLRDGSASPHESDLAMLLGLSPKEGGYWMGDFTLNADLLFQGEDAKLTGGTNRSPDILFCGTSVICEYDSRTFHANEEELERDKDRADGLRAIGYEVVTASSLHFRSQADMMRLMKRLSRCLRTSVESEDPEVRAARAKLLGWVRSPNHQPM